MNKLFFCPSVLFSALASVALASPTFAKEVNARPFKAGVQTAIISSGYLSTMSIGGFGEMKVSDDFAFGGRADYWSIGSLVSLSDLTLGAYGKYFIPVGSSIVEPYLTGGLATHIVTVSSPFGSASEIDPFGVDLGGGVNVAVTETISVGGDLSYRMVRNFSHLQFGLTASMTL